MLWSGLLSSFLEEVFSILLGALYSVLSSGFCAIAEWDIILGSESSSQYGCPMELGPRGALHGRSGMHNSVGRDLFQHLQCAALGFCPKFSCQLCISPEECAAQLSFERKQCLEWDGCTCEVWE